MYTYPEAFDDFLRSGKIQDYLNYIDVCRQPSVRQETAGEQGAYNNRCDCPAGTDD